MSPARLSRRLASLGRGLFRRRGVEHELDAELRFHLERRQADLIATGLNAAEASRQAGQELGSVEGLKQRCREARGLRWPDELRQDLRQALRMLRREPGFAAAAVLTLALGIGVNVTMFSLFDAILARPLPYGAPQQLVRVGAYFPKGALLVFREESRSFASVAAYDSGGEVNFTGTGDPERLAASHVSAELFATLGVPPALGRTFRRGEDLAGNNRVVVLSDAFWRERLGADPAILGQRLTLDGASCEVVGVMPPGFAFPSSAARLWVPAKLDPQDRVDLWKSASGFGLVGRLRPGVTLARAQHELRRLTPHVRDAFPWRMPDEWNMGPDNRVLPLRDWMTAAVRPRLLVVLGAAWLVLLVACADVANLLLARATVRQREVALRVALGGGRRRILKQLLTESLVLAAAGCAAGIAIAAAGVPLVKAILPGDTPRLATVSLDGRVIAFAAALALATGIACGVIPALRLLGRAGLELQPALRSADRAMAGGGRERRRLSATLVVVEVALSVVLLTGAGLLMRTLQHLTSVSAGFRTEHVLTARVTPNDARCRTAAECINLYNALLDRLRALPGATQAAAASDVPLSGESESLQMAIEVEDHPLPPGTPAFTAHEHDITPELLGVLGVPLVRGQAFTGTETSRGERVALINQEMARRFWPGQSPLGKHLRYVWQKDWIRIAGVVGDVHGESLAKSPQWDFYLPYGQATNLTMNVLLRTAGDPAAAGLGLQRAIIEFDRSLPVSRVRTLESIVHDSVGTPRSTMWLLATFSLLALALSAVGIYGVISYSVSRRTQEIGIRMALGATAAQVTRLVLGQALGLAALGAAAGTLGGLAGGRLLRGLLYGTATVDPAVLVAAPLLLALTALLAAFVPARRAIRLDPTLALRQE